MSRGKDGNALIDEDNDATSKTGTSKCADELEQSNPRADQKRPILALPLSSESTSTTSSEENAGYNNAALSKRSATLSIKQSFERLSKIDLSVDHTHHEPIGYYRVLQWMGVIQQRMESRGEGLFWLPLQTSISFEVVGIRINSMTMMAVPRREERYEYIS